MKILNTTKSYLLALIFILSNSLFAFSSCKKEIIDTPNPIEKPIPGQAEISVTVFKASTASDTEMFQSYSRCMSK